MSDRVLTYADLINIIKVGLVPYPSEKSQEFINFGLASELLRYYLGNEWVNQNLFEMHKDVSKETEREEVFLKQMQRFLRINIDMNLKQQD